MYTAVLRKRLTPEGESDAEQERSPVGRNGIEVNGLVREFKGGVRAVDGIDLAGAAR